MNKLLLIGGVLILILAGVTFLRFVVGGPEDTWINQNGTYVKHGNPSAPSPTPTEPLVGGDRDEHGCIPSAGYSWCEALQKCYRPWEEKCVVVSP